MNSELFCLLSDDEFRVKAFAEYCARSQERYSNWISNYNNFIDNLEFESTPTESELTSIVNDYMVANDITEAPIALESGYTTVSKLLINTARQIAANDIEAPGDTTGGMFNDFNLLVTDATGINNHSVSSNIASISDWFKSQLHSVTCLSAAASAYQSAKGDVSSAISIFNDKVSDIFKDAHADISNTGQYFKSILDVNSPIEFIKTCIQSIGVTSEATATAEDDVMPLNNDISKYTGCSPAGPLDFSSVGSAVVATAKVAAGVVVGIAKGIGNLFGSIFSRAAKVVRETIVDPMDLEEINPKGFGTIDGFAYQSSNALITTYYAAYPPYPEDLLQAKYFNKWFAMKTRFGEWLIRMKTMQTTGSQTRILGDLIYKPRIINIQRALTSIYLRRPNDISIGDLKQFLIDLSKQGDALYDLSGLSERERFRGLVSSIEYESMFLYGARLELEDDTVTDDTLLGDSKYTNLVNAREQDWGDIPSTITNLDWIKQASGWDGSSFTMMNAYHTMRNALQELVYITIDAQAIMDPILTVLNFEETNPLSESPFIPYSNNHTEFAPASYRIKTDEDNHNAFQIFLTTAIIVAVAAIVLTTSIVLIKKIARARYFKRAQRVGELDNKMWNGGKLTAAEQRSYVRASKKMSRSNVLSSGLSNDVGSSINNAKSDYNVNILPYIIGD